MDRLNDGKLKFPVSFELRVIMENTSSDEANMEALEAVIEELSIPHKEWGESRKSKEGKYTSYSLPVMIKNHDTLKALYAGLNSVPGVKHAI